MTQGGMFDSEVAGGGGTALLPVNCLGHLLLVWSTGYIEHSPTKFTVPGKKSDVIVVDVVDLDVADEEGYQGMIYRNSWWRNNRLIGFLKNRIGRPRPVLAVMAYGQETMGNKPFELHLMDSDPASVDRAKGWFEGHPDFRPSVPYDQNPEASRVLAEPVAERKMSQLEAMAAQRVNNPHQDGLRQAVAGAAALPPPRPRPIADADIPY